MKRFLRSLRARLFLWYVGSLIIVIAYFLLFIHYFAIPYAIHILIGIFIILAVGQFVSIHKITKSITFLSSKIKLISSENLEEQVRGISGEDEIGELASSFNSLLDRLHEAFKREQQFIADVAHELKTPLTTLRSSFEIVLNKPRSSEDYKKVIEEAIIETDQLSQTLKNVLDLAWSESPNSRNNKKRFSLTELVEDLSEIAQKMAIKKNIEVILFSTPNVNVLGFKDKLARVLLNLIDNSIKYSPKRGKIEIILEKTPNEQSSYLRNKAIVSVTDNGQGISEEDLPHIFDRFYRGSKTDKVLGSGLGLAIAKSIISLHQGEIKVKSSKGKRSTFIVILPLS
ncbi:HAMP domain-containing protein [Candidatus Daviesbacteria bacterium]|nr:HAMP domain-containing protein [Candidatus Daviesbacteria bacterium]